MGAHTIKATLRSNGMYDIRMSVDDCLHIGRVRIKRKNQQKGKANHGN